MLVAELVPAILQVVFSGFPGLRKAADASREDGLYLRTVDAIGVLYFYGIEGSQSSAFFTLPAFRISSFTFS